MTPTCDPPGSERSWEENSHQSFNTLRRGAPNSVISPVPLAAAPRPHLCERPQPDTAVLMFLFLFFFSLFPKDEQIVRMCCRLATSAELRVSGSTLRAVEKGLARLFCIRQPRGKIQTSTFFSSFSNFYRLQLHLRTCFPSHVLKPHVKICVVNPNEQKNNIRCNI